LPIGLIVWMEKKSQRVVFPFWSERRRRLGNPWDNLLLLGQGLRRQRV
jgi:hypothetical protein